MRKMRDSANTITFKLILAIYLILVPIILLLIAINSQTRATLLAQVEATHQNMLQSNIQRVDSALSGGAAYTFSLARFNNSTQQAANRQDEATVSYAKIAVGNDIKDRADTSDLVDGYFALLGTYQGESFLISTHSAAESADKLRIRQYVEENRAAWGNYSVHWQHCTLEGTDYLVFVVTNGEGICAGMYVNLTRLVSQLAGSDAGQLQYLGTDAAPSPISPKGFRLLSQPSETAPIQLVHQLDEREILQSLPFLQRYTVLVSLALLLLIPVMFLLVRLIVAKPLQTLTDAMRRVQQGDLDHRLEQKKASSEIQILVDAFNHMLERISHLKISVYENQLQAQKAQLRNLQLQIRPHFLINSLNMVYNEMESGNNALARQLILHTVDYFRYMVRVDDELVPLTAELNHVRAYLEIQAIRYPDMLRYIVEVDSFVEDVLVPPLAVQTFVENSIKYAIQESKPLSLSIRVDALEKDFEPYACITVSDNGPGYTSEVLGKLQAGAPIVDQNGEHIGIRNVMRRAALIFGDNASCQFYNLSGAVIRLTLPATFR